MAKKSFEYAYYEGIWQEMLRDKNIIFLCAYQIPAASFGELKPIDLNKEIGKPRVACAESNEAFYNGFLSGASHPGLKPIVIISSMADAIDFSHIDQESDKQRGSNGDGPSSFVLVEEITGQGLGGGEARSRYDYDSGDINMPAMKVVVPTTAYDAKGLMIAAIQSEDPVAYLWSGGLSKVADEVPDESYLVPIGKAALRSKGTDISIITHGNGVKVCAPAVKNLQKQGISVDYIDLRSLKPLDEKICVKSVRKTGLLLTVDPCSYALAPGAEVVTACAQAIPEAKFRRLVFPDVPIGNAPEMATWQVVNAEQVEIAAKALLNK